MEDKHSTYEVSQKVLVRQCIKQI